MMENNILKHIPELACPACKGELRVEVASLICDACNDRYEVHDGIPQMLGRVSLELAQEIAVEDHVAIEYEQKRYQIPYAKKYHDWWTDMMLSQLRSGGRILDNGCGVGLLFEKVPQQRLVGLDISAEMLRRAATCSDNVVLGDSHNLPFSDNSFDAVFCRSLLHHLPQPEKAISEIHRVLRSGGEVVFVDTNKSVLSTLPRKIANRGEHFSDDHKNLTRKTIEALLRSLFSIEKVSYFGYIAYPLLGFPDIVNLFKIFPFKKFMAGALMSIDNVISHLPLIRTQSWGILVKATVK